MRARDTREPAQGWQPRSAALTPDCSPSAAAILDRRQPKGLRLAEMLGNGPVAWEEQRATWGFRPFKGHA
jgi:hypothetical protein